MHMPNVRVGFSLCFCLLSILPLQGINPSFSKLIVRHSMTDGSPWCGCNYCRLWTPTRKQSPHCGQIGGSNDAARANGTQGDIDWDTNGYDVIYDFYKK